MESKWGRMPASAHMLVDARMQALEGALAQTDGARVLAHMCRAWTDEFTSTPRVFDPDPAGRRGNNPPPECDYGTANKQPQPIQNLTRDARVWFIRRNEGESTYDNVFCFLYDSGALWFPVPGIEDGVIPNDDHDHAVVCVVPSIAPAVASKDIIGTLPVFDMDHADGLKGGKRTLALAAAINSILLVNSYLQENDEKFHQLFFYVDAQDSWTTFVEPLTKNSYQGRALSAIIEHEDALTADYKSDTKVKRGRDVLMASVLDLLWTMKCEPHTHAVHHVAIAFIKFSLYSCLPKGKLGMHMTQTAFLDMDCAWDTNDGTRARRQAEKLINATREGMPLDNDVAETKIITKAKKLSDAGTKVVHILEEYMPDFVDKDLGTPKQVDVVQAGALAGVAPDNVYHAICEHQTDAAGMSKNSTASFLGTMVHLAYDTAPACFNDTETPALVARAVAVTRPLSAVCVVAGIALRDHAEASGVPKGGVPGGWALVAVLRTPRTQSLFAGMFTPPPKELHAEYTSTKAAMALADSEVTDENEIHSVELKSIWRAAVLLQSQKSVNTARRRTSRRWRKTQNTRGSSPSSCRTWRALLIWWCPPKNLCCRRRDLQQRAPSATTKTGTVTPSPASRASSVHWRTAGG